MKHTSAYQSLGRCVMFDVTMMSVLSGHLLVALMLLTSSSAGENRDCVGESFLFLCHVHRVPTELTPKFKSV